MARAGVDPEFRAHLLADAVEAVADYQQQRVPLAVPRIPDGAPRDRLHPLLVLSERHPRQPAHRVKETQTAGDPAPRAEAEYVAAAATRDADAVIGASDPPSLP